MALPNAPRNPLPPPEEVIDAVEETVEEVVEDVEEVIEDAPAPPPPPDPPPPPVDVTAGDGQVQVDVGGDTGVTFSAGRTAEGQVGLDVGAYHEDDGVRAESGLTANLDAEPYQVGADVGGYGEQGSARTEAGLTANVGGAGDGGVRSGGADVGVFVEQHADGQRATRDEAGVQVGGSAIGGRSDDDTSSGSGTVGVGWHTDTAVGDGAAERQQVDVGVGGGVAVNDDGQLEELRGGFAGAGTNAGDATPGDGEGGVDSGGQIVFGGRVGGQDGRASAGVGVQVAIGGEGDDGVDRHGSGSAEIAVTGVNERDTVVGGAGVRVGGDEHNSAFLGVGGGAATDDGTAALGVVVEAPDSTTVVGAGFDRDDSSTSVGGTTVTSTDRVDSGAQLHTTSDDTMIESDTKGGVTVADWELTPEHATELASRLDPTVEGHAGDGQATVDVQVGQTHEGDDAGITVTVGSTSEGQVGVDVGVYTEGDGGREESGVSANLDGEENQAGVDVGGYQEHADGGRDEIGVTVNAGGHGGGGVVSGGIDVGVFAEEHENGERANRDEASLTVGVVGTASFGEDGTQTGSGVGGVGFSGESWSGDDVASRSQSTIGIGVTATSDADGNPAAVGAGAGMGAVNVGDPSAEDGIDEGGGGFTTTFGPRVRVDDDSASATIGATVDVVGGDGATADAESNHLEAGIGVNATFEDGVFTAGVGVAAGGRQDEGHRYEGEEATTEGGQGFVGIGVGVDVADPSASVGIVVDAADGTGDSSGADVLGLRIPLDVFGDDGDGAAAPAPEAGTDDVGADDVLGLGDPRPPADAPEGPLVEPPALDDELPVRETGVLADLTDRLDVVLEHVTDLFGREDDEGDVDAQDDGGDEDD